MSHLELVDEPTQCHRLFDGIEIFALDVLDQRHRERRFVVDTADHRRDLGQPGGLRPTPTALASDDLETFAVNPHHNGLHHASRFDGLGELVEGFRVEPGARLVATSM